MTRTRANLTLLLVALIWGTTFVAQQLVMKDLGPFIYTGSRFLLGALIIVPMALREYARLSDRGVRIKAADLLAWCGLGGLLFGGIILQQIGLGATTVTNAGFLTALYMPLVPVLSWLMLRQRPHFSVWAAVIGSLVGTLLLSGGELSALAEGDYWVIGSTAFWALHVLFVGRIAADKGTPILVALTQFLVCGVVSTLWGGLTETIDASNLWAGLPAILYGGILSVGVGFTLQVVAQRHTQAADAAVLLSAETLFAGLAGALILDERLTAIQFTGCALIFISILAVQLLPMWLQTRPETN
ncbi:DMT family transporter [Dechloromonas denitrificans]|uniref:DMT family transporter n=1 Tax=Dechloromonas denitrificans TaxID=281362 RepID=UPI001CF7F095|nr:DMT family transporter [Dechloromonas denitrificans]UCV12817.1 DMT family transporter [Dechloromonas denitrificans]